MSEAKLVWMILGAFCGLAVMLLVLTAVPFAGQWQIFIGAVVLGLSVALGVFEITRVSR